MMVIVVKCAPNVNGNCWVTSIDQVFSFAPIWRLVLWETLIGVLACQSGASHAQFIFYLAFTFFWIAIPWLQCHSVVNYYCCYLLLLLPLHYTQTYITTLCSMPSVTLNHVRLIYYALCDAIMQQVNLLCASCFLIMHIDRSWRPRKQWEWEKWTKI